MERNTIQPNLNYNPNFTPPNAGGANPQQQPGARPVPSLENASDLSANPSTRNLQTYNTISTPQGSKAPWSLPEYQPIQPGEPYMEKLADEAANTKRMERFLKHAQECEADGDLQDAEKNYKKALKYTDSAEHYKRYAGCLRAIYVNLSQIPLTPEKDVGKERTYREKAARAFYYLGELYAKQRSWNPAQAAYKASCELALYETPLKALVDVARQLGEARELAHALVKLADFYEGKGDTALAIQMLEEALQVEKSSTILEKLAALHGQVGGEDSQLKVNETRIHQFELQLSQDPKNIGLYRKYAWFLKDIGRKSEARAVKERMDELLQQKLVKQKAKMGGFKQTIHSQAEIIRHLQEQIQAHVSKTDAALEGLQESLEFSKMTSLSLNNLTTNANYEHEDEDIIPLLHTNPHLKYLSFQMCRHLTDAVLIIIPERFGNLEYLRLNRCHKMTLAGLSAMIDRLPRLKKLLYYNIDGTVQEHNQLISKLNARRIKHGGLN